MAGGCYIVAVPNLNNNILSEKGILRLWPTLKAEQEEDLLGLCQENGADCAWWAILGSVLMH